MGIQSATQQPLWLYWGPHVESDTVSQVGWHIATGVHGAIHHADMRMGRMRAKVVKLGAEKHIAHERQVYRALTGFQGGAIPYCIGHGELRCGARTRSKCCPCSCELCTG